MAASREHKQCRDAKRSTGVVSVTAKGKSMRQVKRVPEDPELFNDFC